MKVLYFKVLNKLCLCFGRSPWFRVKAILLQNWALGMFSLAFWGLVFKLGLSSSTHGHFKCPLMIGISRTPDTCSQGILWVQWLMTSFELLRRCYDVCSEIQKFLWVQNKFTSESLHENFHSFSLTLAELFHSRRSTGSCLFPLSYQSFVLWRQELWDSIGLSCAILK